MASGGVNKIDREALKKTIIELLRSDWEFRRAVAAELGLLEILERMDRHDKHMVALQEQVKALYERMVRLEERMSKLEERLEEHTKAIKTLQEQVRNLQEQVKFLHERILKVEERLEAVEKRLEEHSMAIQALQKEIKRLGDRLAALGSRWGLYAEEAVRETLYKILQEYLGVTRVEKWRVYDERGEVFGRPRVIEIDVVVKDDIHHLIEVKSSVDMYDVYVFNKKCDFYVKNVKPRKVKKIIVTFYADDKAVNAAEELGIEIIKG